MVSSHSDIKENSPLYQGWMIAIGASLAIMVSFGVRSAFGTIIEPLEREFGWSRSEISSIAAVNLVLYGLMQPIVGKIVDRYGGRVVLSLSVLLVGGGVVWIAFAKEIWELYMAYGVVVALGIGLASPVSVSAAVSPWFDRKRGMAISVANSGSPLGQLIFVPLCMWLILNYSLGFGFLAIGAALCFVVFPIVATLLRTPNNTQLQGRASSGALEEHTPLSTAMRSRVFWILAVAMLVCGYSSAGVVITHLIPHASNMGISPMTSAYALAFIGSANFVGVIVTGYLGDRFGRVFPLPVLFVIRGVAHILILTADGSGALFMASIIYGVTHSATMTTTAAIIGDRFGRRSVGTLYGFMLLGHQLAAGLGALLGGYDFDINANYSLTFISASVISILAAVVCLGLRKEMVAIYKASELSAR